MEVFCLPRAADIQCLVRGAGCGQCGCPSRKIRGKEVDLTCLSLCESKCIQQLQLYSGIEQLLSASAQIHSQQTRSLWLRGTTFLFTPAVSPSPASSMNWTYDVVSPELDALFYSLWKLQCPKVRGSKPMVHRRSLQLIKTIQFFIY